MGVLGFFPEQQQKRTRALFRVVRQDMPRVARSVFAGFPHHVTQRGNRRGDVFFCDADRSTYLDWLRQYCDKSGVQILAYCLMTNHIHLVAVPETDQSLEMMLRPLHTRYAMRVNRVMGWKGHVWQGRYFSSALDESYLWAAIRYVERNPVRGGLVSRAEDYRWSSAAAHCGRRDDAVLTRNQNWTDEMKAVPDWPGWLAETDSATQLKELRGRVERGLPCGGAGFICELERRAGYALVPRPRGRPRKGGE